MPNCILNSYVLLIKASLQFFIILTNKKHQLVIFIVKIENLNIQLSLYHISVGNNYITLLYGLSIGTQKNKKCIESTIPYTYNILYEY